MNRFVRWLRVSGPAWIVALGMVPWVSCDAADGPRRIADLGPLEGAVAVVKPAPDNREIAVALASGEILLWPLDAPAPRLRLQGADVTDIAFSPDGKSFAWTQRDGSVMLADRRDGRRSRIGAATNGPATSLLFLLDRKSLVYGERTLLHFAEVATGIEFQETDIHDTIRRLEYGRDGRHLVALTDNEGFALYDIFQMKVERTQSMPCEHVAYGRYGGGGVRMDFIRPGHRAKWYIGGTSDTIEAPYPEEALGGTSSRIATAVHADLLAVIDDGEVRLLETNEYDQRYKFSTGFRSLDSAEFNPSGALLALVGLDRGERRLRVWRMPTPQILPAMVRNAEPGVQFVKESSTMVCIGNTITAWDTKTLACVAALPKSGDQAAFSADGTRLAVGAGSFTDLWDLTRLEPMARLSSTGKFESLTIQRGALSVLESSADREGVLAPGRTTIAARALSPEGALLAIEHSDASIELWDTGTRSRRKTLAKRPREIGSGNYQVATNAAWLTFSPDGRWLAALACHSLPKFTISVFEVASGECLSEFGGRFDGVPSMCWSDDSASYLVGIRRDAVQAANCVVRVDAGTGREAEEMLSDTAPGDFILRDLLLIGNARDHFVIWDLATGRVAATQYRGIGTTFNGGFALSPDRSAVAAAGSHGVELLALPTSDARSSATLKPRRTWHTPHGNVNDAAWIDEERFATVDEEGEIVWWSVNDDREFATTRSAADQLTRVITASNGRRLAVAGSRNRHGWCEIYDTESRLGQVRRQVAGTAVVSLARSPAGEMLAIGTDQGHVVLWNFTNGAERWRKEISSSEIWSVAFHPTDDLLAATTLSANGSGRVQLLRASSGESLGELTFGKSGPLYGVAFSPRSGQLVAGGRNGVLFVGDVSTRQTRRLDSHNAVRPLLAFDWTAEGDRLLLARADQQLQVVRFPDGKLERSLPVHRRSLQTLTLSPSRDRFLTLDVHRAISLWDTRDVAPRDASGRATAEGSRENRSRD